MNLSEKIDYSDPVDILVNNAGFYTGYGVNNEDKQFKGLLEITPVVSNSGVHVMYRTIGLADEEAPEEAGLYKREHTIFNEEHTLVARNSGNKVCLWTLNSNMPTVCVFELRRVRRIANNKSIIIFGFGDTKDKTVFREEITFEIWDAGNIAYNYYWGEPGGTFLARSQAIMRRI